MIRRSFPLVALAIMGISVVTGCGGAGTSGLPDPIHPIDATDAADTDPPDGSSPEVTPNACDNVTAQNRCDGSVLSRCDNDQLSHRDCSEAGLICAFVDASATFDCVAPPTTDACAGETFDGRCQGSQVVYCESSETGVASFDCGPDRECYSAPDGYADCRVKGSGGCGRVTYTGYCDGDVVIWCDTEQTEVVSVDCAEEGATCGLVDDEVGYYCLAPPTADGDNTVTGAFYYEKPAITVNGLGAVDEVPIRRALVQVRSVADDSLLGSGVTAEDGTFTIGFSEFSGDAYVLALAIAERERVSVRDCPLQDCDGYGYVHAVASGDFTPSPSGDIGGWVAGIDGVAGAFNILDVFVRGYDFALANFGAVPPALVGQWVDGSPNICEFSCFTSRTNEIFVSGLAVDPDVFDDSVLAHEFGHFMEAAFSRSDSPGGPHDGSATDPRLAWGEGYGTFFGCELMDIALYIDASPSGAYVVDVSDTGVTANPNAGLLQRVSEYLVAEVLWTFSRGARPLGSGPIFDVLGAYFPTNRLRDRGVSGVDLVDFIDGLLCRGGASSGLVDDVVNARGFPYDFGGPASCR